MTSVIVRFWTFFQRRLRRRLKVLNSCMGDREREENGKSDRTAGYH